MENKLIVRRLVSGILLIVLAVLSFICSNMNANLDKRIKRNARQWDYNTR